MKLLTQFAGAIAFYTCLPVPQAWLTELATVSRFAPLVGVLIGGLLAIADWGLQTLQFPVLTRSAVVIGLGIAITGGLHLDGAMDSADGLAVQDPERRLQVMADSQTGAFGAMAAIALMLLKTTALSDLSQMRWIAFLLTATWGRWAQQWAIVHYPYLKPTGKGSFHKAALQSSWDLLPGLALIAALTVGYGWFDPDSWIILLGLTLGSGAIAIATAAWFHRQLGGHTGDTYGAVVEWTEALIWLLLTGLTTGL